MKKLLLILTCLMFFVSGCAKEQPCVVGEGNICYSEETQQYQIEPDARIRVMVETVEYGQALSDLWNKNYPDHQNVIEPVPVGSYDGGTWLNDQTDIALMWSQDAAQLIFNFMPVDENIEDSIRNHFPEQFGELLNREGLRYVPMNYYGMVFSTNKTMLEEMGYDMTDINEDGLPDEFDTFEELMMLSDQWRTTIRTYRDQPVTAIFPISFSDLWSSLAFLSASDFRFFAEQDALMPGFETEEFLSTLKFIREIGSHSWYLQEAQPEEEILMEEAEEQTEEEPETTEVPSIEEVLDEAEQEDQEVIYPYHHANDPIFNEGWLYDVYLEKLISPFSMVGTWMYYDQMEEIHQQDFLFSPMPSYKEMTPAPMAMTRGYLINKNTKYPSAANAVMQLIRSEEGMQAYIDTVDEIPAVVLFADPSQREEIMEGAKEEEIQAVPDLLYLTFRNENQKQMSYAFSYSQEESMVAYEMDTRVRGWDMLEELDLTAVMEAVMKQEITVEEAQQQLVEQSAKWMTPYIPVEEEEEK